MGAAHWAGFALAGSTTIAPIVAPADEPDLGDLKQALRDRWPDSRRRAVRKLAQLGSEDAWDLVLGALRDAAPEVADEAQLALAEVRDPRVLARLYGGEGLRERDDLARERVAEAFGRIQVEIDGELLARRLEPDDVAVARALCRSIERLAVAGRLVGDRARIAKRLEGAMGSRADPLLRADALAALGVVDPERAGLALAEALADRDAPVRCAGLALAVARGAPSAFGVAERLAADPSPSVRCAALEALEGFATRRALEVLAERLAVEPRVLLRRACSRALQRLTGMRYREDPRPWKHWIAGLPPDWRPGERPETASERAEERSATSLRTFPVSSDRLGVLVDFSGSLWAEREDGRTRKELLDGEVRALLESLPADTELNLIPYATEPAPLRERLVAAEPREVKRLAQEFEECRITGKGNVWDAAMLALEDPRVDCLLIVTDGAPTGGPHWNLELLVDLLVWECRWRRVAFDSVLVDAPPRLQASWARLAAETGGRSVAVDFDG